MQSLYYTSNFLNFLFTCDIEVNLTFLKAWLREATFYARIQAYMYMLSSAWVLNAAACYAPRIVHHANAQFPTLALPVSLSGTEQTLGSHNF